MVVKLIWCSCFVFFFQKEKEIKTVKDKLKETESELNSLKIFLEKNHTQFATVLKPRLQKLYPEKYLGPQGRSKLLRDIRLLKVGLDGKLPSPSMNDAVEFPRIIQRAKDSISDHNINIEDDDTDATHIIEKSSITSPRKNEASRTSSAPIQSTFPSHSPHPWFPYMPFPYPWAPPPQLPGYMTSHEETSVPRVAPSPH